MRNTSYTVDLDDVGSVEVTVDEHGRVEGLSAYPGQRHDVFRAGLHGLVICRNGVPSLTLNGGARPPQAMLGRARSEGRFSGRGST